MPEEVFSRDELAVVGYRLHLMAASLELDAELRDRSKRLLDEARALLRETNERFPDLNV